MNLLKAAIEEGNTNAVKFLISKGENLLSVDSTGNSTLHLSVQAESPGLVSLLLENGLNPECLNVRLETPLHHAARMGRFDIASLLLDSKADINCTDIEGKTPVHLAAENGHIKFVKFCIEKGAKLDVRDRLGRCPLFVAYESENFEVIKMLEHEDSCLVPISFVNNRGLEKVHIAASKGNLALIDHNIGSLCKWKPRRTYEKDTVLHFAANSKIASKIIEYDCEKSIRFKNLWGEIPLHTAVKKEAKDVVNLLINSGSDVNAVNKKGCSPLMYAVETGSLEIVKRLMVEGAAVNARDHDNQTPLHYAAKNGNYGIAKYLLKNGADINAGFEPDDWYWSPIHEAAAHGSTSVIELFVQNDAQICCCYGSTEEMLLSAIFAKEKESKSEGKTPFYIALSRGNSEAAQIIYKLTPKGDKTKYHNTKHISGAIVGGLCDYITFLIDKSANLPTDIYIPSEAVKDSNLEAIKLAGKHFSLQFRIPELYEIRSPQLISCVLDNCMDIDKKDSQGDSYLHHVVARNNSAFVELLLNRGADVNVINNNGLTPLYCVQTYAVAKLLLEHNANMEVKKHNGATPLFYLAEKGLYEVVELLVQQGANTKNISNTGNTILHNAVLGGKKVLVQLLCQKGNHSSAPNKIGRTPLHFASRKGFLGITQTLLSWGANIEAFDYNGATPLHTAASYDNLSVVKYLIAMGASTETTSYHGFTPFMIACRDGAEECVKFFIESRNYDVNEQDLYGTTPLHLSSSRAVSRMLLNAGANIEAHDDYDRTPLCSAVKNGYEEVVEFLLLKGADVSVNTDNLSSGPLFSALDSVEILEVLIKYGINLKTRDRHQGRNILHLAATYGKKCIIQKLLEHNFPINSRLPWIGSEWCPVRGVLGEKDIPVEEKEIHFTGPTALKLALLKGHKEVAELLKANGGIALDYGE